MADDRLSRKAEGDLTEIAIYGFENFGFVKSRAYRDNQLVLLQMLTEHPRAGAIFGSKGDRRRFVHQAHAVYDRISGNSIFVQRILHHSQDALRHLP
ncbi:type II toxin-antitoxin system RelE/ParE family toxin [Asticcacaulis sp. AC402]|uniref:type II toxin-antitoxin system RelE/ParE family toxin n=1 Tax=Asticcacaulis sp. AC402 TaxID=1282361 RepID=UPI00138B0C1B|nr:type II toxin-antitoxin system RelE/ParE family toxin [Asticcacaulis sp. AC402]